MIKITDEVIEPDALYQIALKDENGAVVTFVGVVRNHSGGKRTDHLVYEAYADMAEKKMTEIGDEVRARWGIEDFGILHRIGRLEIGEISVLIAVSSPHRSEAFAACQYAIDRLKRIVPIGKKEVGEDGESWVEGPKAAHSSN